MTKLIGGNISDTPIKNIGDGSAFSVGGGGGLNAIDFSSLTRWDGSVGSNTSVEIVAPGANTEGITFATGHSAYTSGKAHGYIAKASAPSSMTDGLVLMKDHEGINTRSAGVFNSCFVPAGYGIYARHDIAGSSYGTMWYAHGRLNNMPTITNTFAGSGVALSGAANVNGAILINWWAYTGYNNTVQINNDSTKNLINRTDEYYEMAGGGCLLIPAGQSINCVGSSSGASYELL
jgi:hypothetical protein